MHDDPNKTVTGIENIAKRIDELSLKQRHVKIRQVDCHSTVGSSVVVQVCGEISSTPVTDNNQTPMMKRFVQTFVLAPTTTSDKQKYYVHNDIFRYQENQTANSTTENERPGSLNTSNDGSIVCFFRSLKKISIWFWFSICIDSNKDNTCSNTDYTIVNN